MRKDPEKGSGRGGCLLFILIFVAAIYVGAKVIPPYYNAREFEVAIEHEGVKAGARLYSDETIIKDIVSLARSYEIPITEENIRIERYANSIGISVEYEVPIRFELIGYTHRLRFKVKTKNFVGTL